MLLCCSRRFSWHFLILPRIKFNQNMPMNHRALIRINCRCIDFKSQSIAHGEMIFSSKLTLYPIFIFPSIEFWRALIFLFIFLYAQSPPKKSTFLESRLFGGSFWGSFCGVFLCRVEDLIKPTQAGINKSQAQVVRLYVSCFGERYVINTSHRKIRNNSGCQKLFGTQLFRGVVFGPLASGLSLEML